MCLKYFSIAPKNKTKNSKNKNSTSNSSNKGNFPKENTSSNKVTNIKRKLNENKKNKLYEITKYDENSEKFAARRDINSYNRNSEDLEFTEERRKLRLRWAKPGREPTLITLEFLPDLHKYSIETRLSQFHEAYKKLPYLLRKELDEASDEMKKYGYSLRKGEEKWFQNNTSLFDPWIKQI